MILSVISIRMVPWSLQAISFSASPPLEHLSVQTLPTMRKGKEGEKDLSMVFIKALKNTG